MNKEYRRIPVKGYEGLYEIDTDGNIYSLGKNKVLKPWIINSGYMEVYLYKGGVKHVRTIHRLVAEHFIPNPDNLPEVNHIDENRKNNSAGNLEWCTRLYNVNYGTGTERRRQKLLGRHEPYEKRMRQSRWLKAYRRQTSKIRILCVEDGCEFVTYTDVCAKYGVNRKTLTSKFKNDEAKLNGYTFKRHYISQEIR